MPAETTSVYAVVLLSGSCVFTS